MKTFVNYICIFLLLVPVICGCGASEGSGNVLTSIKDVKNFCSIKVSGIQALDITQGDEYFVKVTADDNVIKSVLAYERDGVLTIENRSNMINTSIDVEVVIPDLQLLSVQGRVRVLCRKQLTVKNLEIRLEGSGQIEMPAIGISGKVGVYTRGSGNVRLGGGCGALKIRNDGSGSIFTDDVACDDIQARLTGPGSVFVTTNGSLVTSVEGAGSLFYSGNPATFKKQIKGSGSVVQK